MAEITPQNYPQSTLAAQLLSGGTSLTLATGDGTGKGFSSPAGSTGRLVLKRLSDGKLEILTFTARSGDGISGLGRAAEKVQGDQTAYQFEIGDRVTEVLTNAGLAALLAAKVGAGVRAYHNADQNVSDSTETALALNSERRDDAGEHDTSTNNSRLTAVGDGWRTIIGSATFAVPVLAGTVRRLSIRLNGSTIIARQEDFGVLSSASVTLEVDAVYYLANGDYVELMAYQDSGATLAVKANANYSPEFAMLSTG